MFMTLTMAALPLVTMPIGLTRTERPIEALVTAEDLDYGTGTLRILIVGGLDGSAETARIVHAALEGDEAKGRFALSAIPLANPDGVPLGAFPPEGDAYASHPEAHYLWRWIGMQAPDLVAVVGPDGGLVDALVRSEPAGTGTIPARGVEAAPGFLKDLLARLEAEGFAGASAAHLEIQRRLARSPEEVARQLAVRYGHALPQAVYIPAVALIGRLRLGERADVERIVEPYVSGAKPSLEKAEGSHLAGHLVFAELYERTKKPRYLELARAAADMGFDAQGAPLESMPLHSEMSDAVFMGCPILARVGRLTGEAKYFDMALRHLGFIQRLDLRPDGLYRNSPLNDAAWGRGNAFPALGLALSLGDLPADHAGRSEMLHSFQEHMAALARHQDRTGMWHQVIDVPGSYRELSATCMIAVAMERGVRNGWLEAARYRPLVDRAWYAARARIATDGQLVDVCTGTGKQTSLRGYLDRTAILGPDDRGGAMALLLATELMERDARPAAAPRR
jgi:rhamnogalacturonyl hydrolase YesR